MATHSSNSVWKIPWTGSLASYSQRGCKESDMTEQLTHTICLYAMSIFLRYFLESLQCSIVEERKNRSQT